MIPNTSTSRIRHTIQNALLYPYDEPPQWLTRRLRDKHNQKRKARNVTSPKKSKARAKAKGKAKGRRSRRR